MASLREMIKPGILVMCTSLFVGFLFGCKALAGVLIGALVSGVCGAISASHTGDAWDNAKKDDFGKDVKDERTGKAVCLGKGCDRRFPSSTTPDACLVIMRLCLRSSARAEGRNVI